MQNHSCNFDTPVSFKGSIEEHANTGWSQKDRSYDTEPSKSGCFAERDPRVKVHYIVCSGKMI